eukprot:TRINITY_DN1422_c0_g1_i2.p1 TRINITY_DN1422_c0_g1~~TRINITY_DN1422_c0_g1_i2.p1  ORF type:complete len:194 (-),score=31.11 TRINITY_DN1422_c0_g1_i2:111-692(-)
MIGDAECGRPEILVRYVKGEVSEEEVNKIGSGDDTLSKVMENGGKKYKLWIQDSAGQEKFRAVTSSFYRKANGVVIIYDVADEYSFANCKNWLVETRKYASQRTRIALLGHIQDAGKERAVETEDAKAFVAKEGIDVFAEVSAVDGTGIEKSFSDLVSKIVETYTKEEVETSGNDILLATNSTASKRRGPCII